MVLSPSPSPLPTREDQVEIIEMPVCAYAIQYLQFILIIEVQTKLLKRHKSDLSLAQPNLEALHDDTNAVSASDGDFTLANIV